MAEKNQGLTNQSMSQSKAPKGPTVIDDKIKGPHGSNQPQGPTVITQPNQPQPSLGPNWMLASEEYLTKAGWIKLGTSDRGLSIWQDPMGISQSGEKKPTVRLPIQGGGEEQIMQCVCPPVAWNYNTEDAMMMQRQRDSMGQGLEHLIKVKERELKELKERIAKGEEVAV